MTTKPQTRLEKFLAEHPEYTLDGTQPSQDSANRIAFLRCGVMPVVAKIFAEPEHKERECFAMRHWAATGLVPTLVWQDDPCLIVMSHLPGLMLYTSKYIDGDTAWRSACEETGKAVGALTRVPFGTKERKAFETKFHGALTGYESYLDRIVRLGRSIHANDPAFKNDFWCKSLDFIEARLPAILAEPRVLVHVDVANLHVQNGRFIGFFDFETCRIGSASLQLAASLPMLRASRTAWKLFRHGWELATNAVLDGDDLAKVSACSQLLGWRNISRNLTYDGTSTTGEGSKPADPKPYRRVFEDVNELLLQNTAH